MSLADIAHIQPATVLDVGANTGQFYREAKALWPNARFHLIEGNQACQPFMEATGEDYTIAYLGDSQRTATFYKRKGGGTDTGNSLYRELTEFFADDQTEIETVDLVPLSDLFAYDARFDLCKLDVQGAELDVIRGGLEIIGRAKHILLEVAVVPYNDGAPMSGQVFHFMKMIGFGESRTIGDIVHPVTRQIVQHDVLFSR